MQDGFEYINQLPHVIKSEVTQFLPTKDAIICSIISIGNHDLFRNQYLTTLHRARKLLHQVVCGNHQAVAKMLEKNPALMHMSGK